MFRSKSWTSQPGKLPSGASCYRYRAKKQPGTQQFLLRSSGECSSCWPDPGSESDC
jgi:hypothetical protein